MRTYDPTEPLIYLHFPRCAGRSMVFLLSRWFQQGFHRLNQDESRDMPTPKLATRDRQGQWLSDVRCIHGSFDHGLGCGLPYSYPEVRQYLTVLRDPFDVAVSMYFSLKQNSHQGEGGLANLSPDFGEQFPSVADYLRHYPYRIFQHLPIDIDLTNYWQKLSERFVYIGIFEDLTASIKTIAELLGQKPFEIPRLHASIYDEPVPESLRETFYRDYPLLKRIYDFAAAHYRST